MFEKFLSDPLGAINGNDETNGERLYDYEGSILTQSRQLKMIHKFRGMGPTGWTELGSSGLIVTSKRLKKPSSRGQSISSITSTCLETEW